EDQYRVVGILERTGSVLDRLVLTSLDSVWAIHEPGGTSDNEDAHEHGDEDNDDEHDHEAHEHDEEDHDDEHDHKAHEHDEEDHDDEHDHEAHEHDDEDHDDEHDHEAHAEDDADREITAMLLRYRSPTSAVSLPRQINTSSNLIAAAPAVEVSRVLQLIGVGLDGLRAFAWLLIISAGLSIFAALYGSLRSRRGDIAMLRCLGATRWELFFALLLEGFLLTLMGVVLGFIAGHLVVEILGNWLEQARGVSFTGMIWLPLETILILGLVLVGIAAAAIPALQAYRTDVAKTLAEAP
ncbi:MAG: ABC transporter permease, partial [Pseudomonadota bacterium]